MKPFCYKEQAVENEINGISCTTLCLYLRVSGLNINHATNCPDLGYSQFPEVPPGNAESLPEKGYDCFLPNHF
jgi:hypothetical protein